MAKTHVPVADAVDAAMAKDARPGNMTEDGITVLDMSYYQLLGIRADATDAQIKSAYKKAALKHHPDRNRDDPTAEKRFQEIGEAFQVLSDGNLRHIYDRKGKKTAEAHAEETFQDPGQLFATLFGGERFVDWIGEISLGKDFSKLADISMTEEEKEQVAKEEAAALTARRNNATGTSTPVSVIPAASAIPATTATTAASSPMPAASSTPSVASNEPTVAASLDVHKANGGSENNGATTPTPSPIASAVSKANSKQSSKMSAEQRKQLEALAQERKRAEIERIQGLTNKLKDRIRPYVEAESSSGRSDAEKQEEIRKWEARLREEIEDLKEQSFGFELCKLIGQIYVTKSANYLKAHKSPVSNLFGISTWWGRMKDRGATVKEGWSFLSSTLDVQSAMTAMEKQQAALGDNPSEADMAKMEEAIMGKVMLVTWRGTRFEVASVLRQVIEGALTKEPGVSQTTMVIRAKAILVIGSILQNVKVDESDEERREMERLVAAAAQKKPKKGSKQKA